MTDRELDPGAYIGQEPELAGETIPGGVRPDDDRVAYNASRRAWSSPVAAANTGEPESRPSFSGDGVRLYFGRGATADITSALESSWTTGKATEADLRRHHWTEAAESHSGGLRSSSD